MAEEKQEVTLLELGGKAKALARYLFSKWIVILLFAIGFGIAAALYVWIKKPVYIAEMSFVTETESKGGLSAYAGIAAQFGIDLGGGSNSLFEGDNLIELLKSKHLLIETLISNVEPNSNRLMIQEFLRIEKLDNKKDIRELVFSDFRTRQDRKRDSIIQEAAEQIRNKSLVINKRDKKLTIIDIKMTSKDEAFAKRFCELLAMNAIQYYTDYKIKKSKQNVAILERQTDSVRSLLYGGIGEMAAMNDLNVNPIRQIIRTGTQRKQMDLQANSALYVELVKHLELSRLSLRKETPLIQIIDTPMLPLEIKGIGRLLAGIAGAVIGGCLAILILISRRLMRTALYKERD